MKKNPTMQWIIKEKKFHENGGPATYQSALNGARGQFPLEIVKSSESLGLWLQYALTCREHALFQQYYHLLLKDFTDEEGKPGPSGNKAAHNRTLENYFRIIDCLFQAADIWGNHEYRSMAEIVSKHVIQNNKRDDLLADYSKINAGVNSQIVTLSSINSSALKKMKAHGVIELRTYICMVDLLDHIPMNNGFFAGAYHIKEKNFKYESDVNMVDQALIALNKAEMGAPQGSFFSFIKKEFEQYGALYGMYKSDSKLPASDHEPPALYGLSILYCLKKGEVQFAHSLYEKMSRTPGNKQFGLNCYGSSGQSDERYHSLDSFIPLLAKEELGHALLNDRKS